MTAPCDILIENALIVTVDADRRVWSDGAIAVRNGMIVAIGRTADVAPNWTPAKRIDAAGGMVHPGFIDGHYHAGLHLIRGALSDDPNVPAVALPGKPGPFGRWLNALTDDVAHLHKRDCEVVLVSSGAIRLGRIGDERVDRFCRGGHGVLSRRGGGCRERGRDTVIGHRLHAVGSAGR